jgi:putative SOS response-associated peptidase YedK
VQPQQGAVCECARHESEIWLFPTAPMRYSFHMCYSAMVEQSFRAYLRMTGAEMDLDQFREIFGARMEDRGIRIPRGFERNFDHPSNAKEQEIKRLIDAYGAQQSARLEADIFVQRKRLADAQRKLATKETKAALESKRIALSKIELAMEKLALLKGTQAHEDDDRIFPMAYAPLVIHEGGRSVVKLARYHCRQAKQPAEIDRKFPGLYNARRDNLQKFWANEFTHSHALMLVHSFFENVEREGRNQVLHFLPQPAGVMFIACLYSRWRDQDGRELLSFAAITDEPPEEVRAAGHDRIIVSLLPSNATNWLTPEGRSVTELQRILDDRPRPYYEHRIAA